jgi:protein phosphatase PTC1
MKEWVIGNPYTTSTELTNEDAFLILACDGVWDVCTDQNAVDLIKDIQDPQEAADELLNHALGKLTTDNLSVIVVRLNRDFVVA